MALDADALVDRRRLKRSLTFWRLVAVIAVVGLAVLAVGRTAGSFMGRGDYIARLAIDGLIVNDRGRLDALDRIAATPRARALIVAIDSPGGTVVGGEALFDRLRKVAARKPVVAVMGEMAASGGYMVALAADRIFAHESTITGSIGVIFQTAEFSALLDKIGIKPEEIKSSPLKAAPSPFHPMTPAAREMTQGVVDDIYAMFVRMTAERRHLAPERARQLADGRIYTGRQALGNGLIDAIGGEAAAREWLNTARGLPKDIKVRDVEYGSGLAGLAERLDTLARKTVFSERLTLDGLVSVWHADIKVGE
jgi:protease IV